MVLTDTQILALLEKPVNRDMLERARTLLAKHQLHIKGDGLIDFLCAVDTFENETQLNLRRKLAKPASVPIMAPELNTFNYVFSAQGGSHYYDFSSESDNLKADFTSFLSGDIGDGYNMRQWMQEVWMDKVNYDCTGVLMVELPGQITKGDVKPYLIWKSVMDMHDVEFSGNRIEYIIFVKIVKAPDGGEYREFRVVDDARDVIVINREGNYAIQQETIIKNFWGYVPARFMSNVRDSRSRARTSYIWEAIGTLEEYLLDSSIHTISKKLHQFPQKWQRKRVCGTCSGARQILNPLVEAYRMESKDTSSLAPMIPCGKCGGTGEAVKTDVSDVILIPALTSKEEADNVPVAGYIQPDLETLREQRDELMWLKYLVHMAIWAEENSQSITADNTATGEKTATEDNNDIEAICTKLSKVSQNAEEMERFLVDTMGKARYGFAYKGSMIHYGRKYYMRSAEQIEKIYTNAKKAGLASHVLDAYLEELISVKFAYDPVEREVQLKLSKLEPFVHLSASEVKLLGVPKSDYLMKVYFNDYIERFEREEKSISLATVEEILEKITLYNTEKLAAAKTEEAETAALQQKPAPFGA